MNTHQPDLKHAHRVPNSGAKHVLIIGGGITGLSAAWYLEQETAKQSVPLRFTLVEQSSRWGGKVQTEIISGFGDAPFILEAGPDAFLTRKPWAMQLAQELGLTERILPVNTDNNRTFVLHRGKPVPLPDGLQLLVPTQIMPFLRSPLFSLRGKLRAGLDLLLPARRSQADETLANFIRRRLGAEMLDKLGEPLLGGVYNNDPERQSIQATFPQFPALEQQHGSLIRGMLAAKRQRGPEDTPPFISFKTGTHELVTALVDRLSGDMRLNTAITRIERIADHGYRALTADGGIINADAVILTTPAHITSRLLQEISPGAAQHLSTIPYAGIGTAYFAFYREDVPQALKGFGVVIPRSERRSIDGVTFTSSKWDGRAPAGYVLLRVFFGGPRTVKTLTLTDDQLFDLLRSELKSIFAISAQPVLHRVYRWQDAYPQYNLGHLERVAAAEAALPEGVYIAGSAYRGVGVPDCIRQGRDAAKQAIIMLFEQFQPE